VNTATRKSPTARTDWRRHSPALGGVMVRRQWPGRWRRVVLDKEITADAATKRGWAILAVMLQVSVFSLSLKPYVGVPTSGPSSKNTLPRPAAAEPLYTGAALDLGLGGKVAVVTGASRGIGRSIALRLAAEGAHVGICGRTADTLEQTLTELRSRNVRAHAVVNDVTLTGEVERFVDEVAAELGGVDLAVANVGGSSGGELLASSAEDWARTFELNLFHAVRTIRASVPHMRARGGGSAVSIASISGWKPAPRAQYGAAKAGEIFLASALAWELAPYRIRVNTVSPGSIMFVDGAWERFRAAQPDRFAEFERREFPWGRLGSPDEVADAVAFVLSDRAAWINGANIPVDGAQGRPSAF